ncbi:hypothetical protein AGMMS49593_07210 [Endomicrobiia bacterium]|nr:hypothetical protein AGMMS49593_07210 [Endomicrobiia bacterium]
MNRCTLTLSLDNIDTLINALTADDAAARLATETATAAEAAAYATHTARYPAIATELVKIVNELEEKSKNLKH